MQALRYLQSAGYDATVALLTLSKVTLPGRAQPAGALEAAEAALQLPFALPSAPTTFSNSRRSRVGSNRHTPHQILRSS